MNNIDPLIRREFERLGMNIIANEDLADLVTARVSRQRIKLLILAVVLGLTVATLVSILYFSFFNSKNQISLGNVNTQSLTQKGDKPGILSLPQAGYIDVNGQDPAKSKAAFIFELQQGWIIQEITDNPDPIMGEAGKVEVFQVVDGKDILVQQYLMSSRTQINEFGVRESGIHKFVLTFNNPNFKGRVRVAFVRSN